MATEIIQILDDGGFHRVGWYAKGHHDPHDFVKALRDYGVELYGPTHLSVRQGFCRFVPCGKNGSRILVTVDGPGHGAFAVTFVEV